MEQIALTSGPDEAQHGKRRIYSNALPRVNEGAVKAGAGTSAHAAGGSHFGKSSRPYITDLCLIVNRPILLPFDTGPGRVAILSARCPALTKGKTGVGTLCFFALFYTH